MGADEGDAKPAEAEGPGSELVLRHGGGSRWAWRVSLGARDRDRCDILPRVGVMTLLLPTATAMPGIFRGAAGP